MNNIVHSANSELSMAITAIALGFGKLIEILVQAEPLLASLSYLVAIIAGLVTIYYKFRRKS